MLSKVAICTFACFVQIAFSQVLPIGNNCGCQSGQAINLGNLGNLGNIGNLGNLGAIGNLGNILSLNNGALNNAGIGLNNGANLGLNLANSLPGSCLSIGGLPNGIGINNGLNNAVVQGSSPQIGYGDVAILGELPVAGPTAVCGNVPVIGYVMFEGNVPAGGLVSVVDPCGCGCN